LVMSAESAELTKYAANGMLALRISFMNELSNLCDRVGANIDDVRRGISSDARIGKSFLYAGPGYGGSCFPKDVKALAATGRTHGVPQTILEAADLANQQQRGVLLQKIHRAFDGDLAGKTVAIWGLAFKPMTDDIREAPALALIEGLLASGARVAAYDPAAMENTRARFGDKLTLSSTALDAAEGADALVLVTEWQEFRMPNWDRVRAAMRGIRIFDGRNIYDRLRLENAGFLYEGIGRPRL
jgi:UDPglucose 6-dehydrogenase